MGRYWVPPALLYSSLVSICVAGENLFSITNMISSNLTSSSSTAAEAPYLRGTIGTDPSLSNTAFMTMTRKQAQFLSCGAPKFGNIIPTDYNDFVLRLGSSSVAFHEAHPSVDDSFGWSIPVEWSSTSKRVRWTEMAKILQLSLDAFRPPVDTYLSRDKRYLMPNIKIDVKTDTNAGCFDVFLFAPESVHRPSGTSLFRMGVPQSLFPVVPSKSPSASPLAQDSSDRSPVSVMGLSNNVPFVALAPSGVEDKLKIQTEALVQEQAQVLSEKLRRTNEELKKKADIATATASGVVSLATGNNPAVQLQQGIAQIVQSATGQELTAAQKVKQTISKINSGNVDVADVSSAITAITDAAGLPTFRRLKDNLMTGSSLAMTNKPFVIADLTVYDTVGKILYGPVSMHCPFISIPVSKLKTSDTILMFQVTLRTRDGAILADDLSKPYKAKKFVFTEQMNDKVDDPSKCPQLVLGTRLLDVDFDEFTNNAATRLVVRHLLAESLGVSRNQITFCETKRGSTIIGFDAESDMTLQWGEIVADPSAPIHRVLQLDSEFYSLVDKDDLYNRNPVVDEVASNSNATTNVPEMEYQVVKQRDGGNDNSIVLPIFETDMLDSEGNRIPVKDEVMPLPDMNLKKRIPSIPEDEGLPAWTWALIGIGIFVVVGLLITLVVLYILSQRKLKNDDDIAGQSLDLSAGENTFSGGDHSLPGEVGRVGVSVEIRSPAAHREGRRHYDN